MIVFGPGSNSKLGSGGNSKLPWGIKATFLALYFFSKIFSKELGKFATGIKVFRFNINDLKTIYTSVPPLSEQKEISEYIDLASQKIKTAIESYSPKNNRSQIINHNGHQIILDAYNANPTSMTAALNNFSQMKGKHKIAFLGDMFELGSIASTEHLNIANLASKLNFDETVLVGENFNRTETNLKKYSSFNNLKESLKDNPLPPKSLILIKGSRGMALERILDYI